MKVRELLERLKGLPVAMLDADVVLQADPEGNGFIHLTGADPDGICLNPGGYNLEILFANWSADEACIEPEVWQRYLAKPRCLVLSP